MTAKPTTPAKSADLIFRGVEFCDGCGDELDRGNFWGLCAACEAKATAQPESRRTA